MSKDLPLPLWIIDYRFKQKHELRASEKAIKALHQAELSANGGDQSGG
ncbi:UNVERIFIED_ORG: hypothetical protein ABIB52_002775 [Arthrobacter sp. UYCu721]